MREFDTTDKTLTDAPAAKADPLKEALAAAEDVEADPDEKEGEKGDDVEEKEEESEDEEDGGALGDDDSVEPAEAEAAVRLTKEEQEAARVALEAAEVAARAAEASAEEARLAELVAREEWRKKHPFTAADATALAAEHAASSPQRAVDKVLEQVRAAATRGIRVLQVQAAHSIDIPRLAVDLRAIGFSTSNLPSGAGIEVRW